MRRRSIVGSLIGAALASSGAIAQTASAEAKSSLAPTGTLRVAINYGNAVLAVRDGSGKLSGASVDIAQELARRLDLPIVLIPFDAAGKVSAAVSGNVWDVAFLAKDPNERRVSASPPPMS